MSRQTPQVRKKVKTGCGTCRKRRVKCDEARPVCARCLSTGRVCDGYGIWGGGGNAYGSVERTSASALKPSHQAALVLDHRSSRNVPFCSPVPGIGDRPAPTSFDYFQRRTASKLPGVFEYGFWDKLVLQACAQEPAVLHAVTALGAAHRNLGRTSLAEYNKSIHYLRQHLIRRQDKEALRVSLITCMIFICLDLVKGEFKSSQTHLQHGLRILREIQSQYGPTSTTGPVVLRPQFRSIEDYLVEAFTRLNIPSALFGQGSMYLYHLGENTRAKSSIHVVPMFDTVRDARRHLDALINGTYSLSEEACKLVMDQHPQPSNFQQRQDQLLAALACWQRGFDSSYSTMSKKGNVKTRIGLPLLRIYHTMTFIMAATALRGTNEGIFDSYTQEFSSILHQTADLGSMLSVLTSNGILRDFHLPEVSFTADMGFITPLYFTAMRCRVPSLRRQAIDKLSRAPHREGAWGGPFVSRIAEHVMVMEEDGIFDGIDFKPDRDMHMTAKGDSLECMPIVPLPNRITHVTVELPENVGGKAMLICAKYRKDNEIGWWEMLTTQFKVVFEEHSCSTCSI